MTLSHASLAITAALFDSLWEGALIVGAAALVLRYLPKLGAATRYAIWLCVLGALMLVPLITVSLPYQRFAEPAAPTAAIGGQLIAITASVAKPKVGVRRATIERTAPISARTITTPDAARNMHIAIPQSLAIAVGLLWLVGVGWRALLLWLNIRELGAMRREATLRSSAHGYPVLLSARLEVPLAVGFLHPAVILPDSLVEQLSADAIDTVILHEVAHLRRYDVWTNAFARIAEALLFFSPLAWFVIRQLSAEREIGCDDWVVAGLGAGELFARALETLATRARSHPPLAAPSAIGSRHSIVERIERLLDSRPRRLRLSPSALGGALMLLAFIALIFQSVSPVLAYQPQATIPIQAAAVQIASNCTMPNSGIKLHSGIPSQMGGPAIYGLEDANKIVARFGAANVATVDVTVDANGKASKVVVVSAPRLPGMTEHVQHMFMDRDYPPAVQNCAAVASTIRTGVRLGRIHRTALSIVAPVYPDGWSAQHKAACKVPPVLHTDVPAFPESMNGEGVDELFKASVSVHVDAAGAVKDAAIVTSTGQRGFDDALLAEARSQRYPLAENTGFKPVRPSSTGDYTTTASRTWTAANRSSVYSKCSPLPTEYVWTTTFGQAVPHGFLGSTIDAMMEGQPGP